MCSGLGAEDECWYIRDNVQFWSAFPLIMLMLDSYRRPFKNRRPVAVCIGSFYSAPKVK